MNLEFCSAQACATWASWSATREMMDSHPLLPLTIHLGVHEELPGCHECVSAVPLLEASYTSKHICRPLSRVLRAGLPPWRIVMCDAARSGMASATVPRRQTDRKSPLIDVCVELPAMDALSSFEALCFQLHSAPVQSPLPPSLIPVLSFIIIIEMRAFSTLVPLLLCLSCTVLVANAALLGQHGCLSNTNDGNWKPLTKLSAAYPLRRGYNYYVGYQWVKGQNIRFSAEIARDGLHNYLAFRNRPADPNVKTQHKAQYSMNIKLKGGQSRRYWLDSQHECQNTLQYVDFRTANVVGFSVDVRV